MTSFEIKTNKSTMRGKTLAAFPSSGVAKKNNNPIYAYYRTFSDTEG